MLQADKQAKKDKHKVGQKRQQKMKKGSDADSDASSEEDGYMDSKEMDYLSDSSSSSEGQEGVLLHLVLLQIRQRSCSIRMVCFNCNQFWWIWLKCPNRALFQWFLVATIDNTSAVLYRDQPFLVGWLDWLKKVLMGNSNRINRINPV